MVCSNCGEQNAPGTQFCTTCHAYLGWRDDPTLQRLPPVGTGAPPPSGSAASPAGSPLGPGTAPDPSSAPTQDMSAIRDPFEARIVVADATLPLDGTPATVTAEVANTSTIVDSYVVEALDPPSWLEFRAGRTELLPGTTGSVEAMLRIMSPTMVAAQELPLLLRVRNLAGQPAYRDIPVRVTVPVLAAPLTLLAEPRLVRVQDNAPVTCTVVVDNSRSNHWADVRLSANDPEQVVRASWRTQHLQVPPGGEARTEVRFTAPPPDPGREMNRTITISGTDGERYAETTVTLAQSASQAAFGLLTLQLEPSVLRLGGGRRGTMTAVVDNRRGAGPVRLSLGGYDTESTMRFGFSPKVLDVQPGQVGSALVSVVAPRVSAGKEVTRPLTIVASDGRADIRADGSVVQFATSQRGLARILLTLLGAVLMVLGASMQFVKGVSSTAFQLTVAEVAKDANGQFSGHSHGFRQIENAPAADVVSLGLGFLVLAALMAFGLTGPTGRLTRRIAILSALVLVGSYIGAAILYESSAPAVGAFVILAGCVVGYIGGLLARR